MELVHTIMMMSQLNSELFYCEQLLRGLISSKPCSLKEIRQESLYHLLIKVPSNSVEKYKARLIIISQQHRGFQRNVSKQAMTSDLVLVRGEYYYLPFPTL